MGTSTQTANVFAKVQRQIQNIQSFNIASLRKIIDISGNKAGINTDGPTFGPLFERFRTASRAEIKTREQAETRNLISSSFETERARSIEEITNVFETKQSELLENQNLFNEDLARISEREGTRLSTLLDQIENTSIETKNSSFLPSINNIDTKTLLIGAVVIAALIAVTSSKVRK